MPTVADCLVARCASLGVTSFFGMTGGGIMHLIDAVVRNSQVRFVSFHHEASAGLAADAYARSGAPFGVVLATTGPGVANVFTAVVGAWQDSVPILVIAGQVKKQDSTHLQSLSLRQNGTFEFDSLSSYSHVTKGTFILEDPEKFDAVFEQAVAAATEGRPGPVILELPLDIQGFNLESKREDRPSSESARTADTRLEDAALGVLKEELSKARKPLVILGAGLLRAGCWEPLVDELRACEIPYVVTQFARQLGSLDDPLYLGSPGIKANRSANLAVASADLLVAVGTSLHQQVIGWSQEEFSRLPSTKIWFEIDPATIDARGHLVDYSFNLNSQKASDIVREALAALSANGDWPGSKEWKAKCRELRSQFLWHFPSRDPQAEGVCLYKAIQSLTSRREQIRSLTTDAGVVWYALAQHYFPQRGSLYISSGSFGAMGMALGYAIGSAEGRGGPVVCMTGDGSLMTMVQDLATLKVGGYPILLIVNNNDGYLSIRTTHDKFFEGRKVGTDESNGVFIPRISRLAETFGLDYLEARTLTEFEAGVDKFLGETSPGPLILEIFTSRNQSVEPYVQSSVDEDGTFRSGSLADMFPPIQELS